MSEINADDNDFRFVELEGTLAVCDRCEGTEHVDVEIHQGQSIRRDCARCGRTLGFPIWYGEREAAGHAEGVNRDAERIAPPQAGRQPRKKKTAPT